MARQITQAAYVRPQAPDYVQKFVCLMDDGTVWILRNDTHAWSQAPALPGSRVVTCILAPDSQIAARDIDRLAGYAACSDGTIWRAPLATGVWTQVAVTP